jgi:dihydropteroate synthase
VLDCAGRPLDLSLPVIMGVVNTTPDSFSDGGTLFRGGSLDLDAALKRAAGMVAQGAGIIDIGGESTRPGARAVSIQEEMGRVLPLVERIASELDVVISIDTSTPELMTEGARLGAGMLNDVRALSRQYQDVVKEVGEFLERRILACQTQGIDRERLLLDPGFGFGKSVEHNLLLLRNLPRFAELGMPLLVGLSRKSLIGKLLGREVDERLPASLALAVMAVERGAAIIRTHDVQATADALAMWTATDRLGDT